MTAIDESGRSRHQASFCKICQFSLHEFRPCVGHPQAMLTEIYISALQVDEKLADQVWGAWDSGEIDDAVAYTAWILIAAAGCSITLGQSTLSLCAIWPSLQAEP